MSFIARGLSNIIGIIVPVIHSFKVLKKPTKPKLIQCLHYWTIYGSFLITDWFLNTFFISCFIPFYDFFILTFTLLIATPHLGFASILYTKFLAPFLRKYERRIDSVVTKSMEKLWQKMPAVAMTVPAVLASIVSAFNNPMDPPSYMEVEEMDDSIVEVRVPRRRSQSRSISRSRTARSPRAIKPVVDQSFEIQDEDENDENDGGDVFRIFPLREVKRELLEEDEQEDEVAPIPPRRSAPMQTRRQLRARSVL